MPLQNHSVRRSRIVIDKGFGARCRDILGICEKVKVIIFTIPQGNAFHKASFGTPDLVCGFVTGASAKEDPALCGAA